MSRQGERLTVWLDTQQQADLAALATHLNSTAADVLRLALHELAAKQLGDGRALPTALVENRKRGSKRAARERVARLVADARRQAQRR